VQARILSPEGGKYKVRYKEKVNTFSGNETIINARLSASGR
jgi:hypothetical protein